MVEGLKKKENDFFKKLLEFKENIKKRVVRQYLTTLFDFSLSISVLDQLLMLLLLILL